MGRRTIRILARQLQDRLSEIHEKDVQLITWEGKTYFGLARIKEGNSVLLEDKNVAWYNRKKHSHLLKLSEIREVIFDKISDW